MNLDFNLKYKIIISIERKYKNNTIVYIEIAYVINNLFQICIYNWKICVKHKKYIHSNFGVNLT